MDQQCLLRVHSLQAQRSTSAAYTALQSQQQQDPHSAIPHSGVHLHDLLPLLTRTGCRTHPLLKSGPLQWPTLHAAYGAADEDGCRDASWIEHTVVLSLA